MAAMIEAAVRYALDKIAVPAGRTLWLYGEPSFAVGDVYHPQRDEADLLQRKGHVVYSDHEELGRDYNAVFLNCPKQHDEAEGLLALALDRSRGFVMCVARNDAGGNRLRRMMEAYGVPVESLAKSHCQIVRTEASSKADRTLLSQNLLHLAPRPKVMDGEEWWTVPGIFNWNQIDPGSRLLMQHLPADLSGSVADFGCGYGYISAMLARHHPAIRQIDAYDLDARAIFCCARNGGEKIKPTWQDIKKLSAGPLYDAVVMNPPFHAGKDENVDLGRTFIIKALETLRPRGRLFLVANRHLPYEKVVPGLTHLYQGEGYKILMTRVP